MHPRRSRVLLAAFTLLASACARSPPNEAPGPALVYVVRHAEAWKDVPDAPPGVDLDALTPPGQAQAEALGRWLAERGGADAVVRLGPGGGGSVVSQGEQPQR